MNRNENLGSAPIGKLLFSLALPSIVAQLVNILYNMVDRIYIGNMANGSNAMAGLSVALPIITIIFAITNLLGIGGAPLCAIRMGEGKKDEAEKIMTNSFVLLCLSSLILTVLILIFKEPLLILFGATSESLPQGLAYIRIYICGTIFVQLATGMNAYITTQGYAKTSMLSVLIGAVLNIILDPVFIFVFDMGVAGAATATVISQAVSAFWVIHFLFSSKSTLRIQKKYFCPSPKIALAIMSLGISPFIMSSTEGLLQVAFNNQMALYGGTISVGSMSILYSLQQFINMPLSGITQGAQPILSYNYGAKNYERVRKTFQLVFKCALTLSLTGIILMVIFSKQFARIFSSDPIVLEYTGWAIRVFLSGSMIFGAQIACQQTFMALGQAKTSLVMALFRKVILLVPCIYIFPFLFGHSGFAIAMASPVSAYLVDGGKVFASLFAETFSDVTAAVVTTLIFMRFYKKSLCVDLNKQ